jgi:hypothetical protein
MPRCIAYIIGDRKQVSFITPYNHFRRLEPSVAQQRDPVQYLKSLVPRLVAKISWMKFTSAGAPVAWGCPRSGQVPRA